MNPCGWGRQVVDSKLAAIHRLQRRGLRVVAVVDNEPTTIQALAETDRTSEILFLHADTIFESQRVVTPRTFRGSTYDLAELIPEKELRRRVQFVWHGVNDEANLRQFLASGVHWQSVISDGIHWAGWCCAMTRSRRPRGTERSTHSG
jgi:hypothetical protein